MSYTGPSTFHRCLAARQLTWLTQQPDALSEPQTLGLLLPLVLAVANDPSPSVRQYGHAALGWLGLTAGGGGGLQWQAALLREEARRLVMGCEESCWPTAFPAATSLILVGFCWMLSLSQECKTYMTYAARFADRPHATPSRGDYGKFQLL